MLSYLILILVLYIVLLLYGQGRKAMKEAKKYEGQTNF